MNARSLGLGFRQGDRRPFCPSPSASVTTPSKKEREPNRLSLFRLYETSFNNMSLGLGNQEESENHVRNARSVIDSFPAWRRFWEEEAGSGSFTSGFTEAVDAAPSAPDFGFMVQPKSAR